MTPLDLSDDAVRTACPASGCELPSAVSLLLSPLPSLDPADRVLLRAVGSAARLRIRNISGLEHVGPDRDPFILAVNHSSRLESLLVPALLILVRGGRRIHFLADWNFRMIPGIGLLYRRAGAITVPNKPARPRILNRFRARYRQATPPLEQARQYLFEGRPVGVFPEGTVNRNPLRLKRGRLGAAKLSLETGIPVVPAGLRFPTVPLGAAVPEGSPMEIRIGPPLHPGPEPSPAPEAVRHWHAEIMTAIAELSGKAWPYQPLSLSRGEDP